MTNINLLPPEIFERRKAEQAIAYIVLAFIAFILVLVFVFSLIRFQVYSTQKKVASLERKRQELNTKIAKYKIFEQRKKEYEAQKGVVDKAMAQEISWHRILNQIAIVIPSDVWLTEFTGEATGIKFKGYTFGHPSVAEWLDRQTQIKELAQIWLSYSQKATLEQQEVVEFESTVQFGGAGSSAGGAPSTSQGKK